MLRMGPPCLGCTHWHGSKGNWVWTCDAYPAGIPEEIRYWEVDHRKPYKGDNGVLYEPRDQPHKKRADRIWDALDRK
ncbi:hypothetical protein J2S03_003443 [Alicyclobacillus cycloheptanicus]|uniref:HNH endonuclease n=1 Tax=Alicyclobacillus cycloheptanicus TaxID=1457 RepID=A0ABT9XMP5_9BACL|nr:hypothetical protein [Alicyclobacillus cycloheptanicus]